MVDQTAPAWSEDEEFEFLDLKRRRAQRQGQARRPAPGQTYTAEQEDAIAAHMNRGLDEEALPGVSAPAGGRPGAQDEARRAVAIREAEAAGWKAPGKRVSTAEAATQGFSQLSTFNLGDEASAGVNAGASWLWNLRKGPQAAGKAAGETWKREMDAAGVITHASERDRPVAYYGAGVAPAAASVPLLLKQAASTAAKPAAQAATGFWDKFGRGAKALGKLGAGGAVAGEVAGVGYERGTLPERVQKAGWEAPVFGATASMAAGPIANLAVKGIKGAAGVVSPMFMDVDDRAKLLIARAMKRDGVDLADLEKAQRAAKAMGGDTLETLAELAALTGKGTGRNLRGLARALYSVPGRAGELAEQLIEKRRGAIHTGASKAVAAGSGQDVSNYAETLSDLEAQLKQASDEAWEKFREGGIDEGVFRSEIAPTLQNPRFQAAMETAQAGLELQATSASAAGDQKLAQSIGEAAAAVRAYRGGNPSTVIPPRALDEIRRALDDEIESIGRFSYTGEILSSAKAKFAERISAATSGRHAEAMGIYSGGKRLQEAIEAGYQAAKQKPWQLDQTLAGSAPGRTLTQEEFEGVTMGFARALQDMIDSNDLSAVRGVLRNKGMQQKLKQLFGPRHSKFMKRMERMVNRQDFDNFVSKGSPTARIMKEIDDASEEDVVTRAFDSLASQAGGGGVPSIGAAISAATIKPAVRAAGDFWRRLKYRGIGDARVNEKLGGLMFTPMKDKAMGTFSDTMRGTLAKPPSQAAARAGDMAGVAAAAEGGRQGVDAGSIEQEAQGLVEAYEAPLVEEYLNPATDAARRKEIELAFGSDAAALWALRLKAQSAGRGGQPAGQ